MTPDPPPDPCAAQARAIAETYVDHPDNVRDLTNSITALARATADVAREGQREKDAKVAEAHACRGWQGCGHTIAAALRAQAPGEEGP